MHSFPRTQSLTPVLFIGALFTWVLLIGVLPVSAVDFFVTSSGDEGDGNPGNGICSTPGPIASCTLRAAVEEANALAGFDRIFLGVGTVTIASPGLLITDNVSIQGAGADQTLLQGDGNEGHRGFTIFGGLGVSILDLAIRGFSLDASQPVNGGGMLSSADLLVLRGVWMESNASRSCGGLFLLDGFAEIRNSTFSHNVAAGEGSGGGQGGALCLTNGADALVVNTTFFGNSALAGGAISMTNFNSDLDLESSTLVGNVDRSSAGQGGVDDSAIYLVAGTIDVAKTIFDGTCAYLDLVTSDGGNMQSPDASCLVAASGDQPNLTLQQLDLGELGDYGGSVPTMLPGLTSLAVEPPLSQATCSDFDARGEPRVGRCDVGAVERQLEDPDINTLFRDNFETGDTGAWSDGT